MRGTCQPLRHTDDVFEMGFVGSDRETRRALNHVRIERWTIIGALNIVECVSNTLDIAHVGHCDLGPLQPQLRATAVFPMHHRADGITCA